MRKGYARGEVTQILTSNEFMLRSWLGTANVCKKNLPNEFHIDYHIVTSKPVKLKLGQCVTVCYPVSNTVNNIDSYPEPTKLVYCNIVPKEKPMVRGFVPANGGQSNVDG